MTRYSDDMINILVRDALQFEKKKKFEEAIDIYEELALQGVEYAIDRIPIAKHRLDNYKLRKVDLATSILYAITIGVSIVTVSYNAGLNLITDNNLSTSFAFNKIDSQKGSPFTLDVNYHSINDTQLKNSTFEILVPNNINRKNLSKRVIEAVETYLEQLDFELSTLTINIKTKNNNEINKVGYIQFDKNKPTDCDVFILKGKL